MLGRSAVRKKGSASSKRILGRRKGCACRLCHVHFATSLFEACVAEPTLCCLAGYTFALVMGSSVRSSGRSRAKMYVRCLHRQCGIPAARTLTASLRRLKLTQEGFIPGSHDITLSLHVCFTAEGGAMRAAEGPNCKALHRLHMCTGQHCSADTSIAT